MLVIVIKGLSYDGLYFVVSVKVKATDGVAFNLTSNNIGQKVNIQGKSNTSQE